MISRPAANNRVDASVKLKNGAKLPYEPVHGSLRGSDGGQAPKRRPTAVGAVFGNGISSRVRQKVICELQELGPKARNDRQR